MYVYRSEISKTKNEMFDISPKIKTYEKKYIYDLFQDLFIKKKLLKYQIFLMMVNNKIII